MADLRSAGCLVAAMQKRTAAFDGPQALIQHAHTGLDLMTLADKLCLQEHLDGAGPRGIG